MGGTGAMTNHADTIKELSQNKKNDNHHTTMNNKLYGNLIFELSHPGRKGYSLPSNDFESHPLPSHLRRQADASLPECDELTVVRHYTNHSANNFGVNNGFYPLGSCTMKYNPVVNEEIAALPGFTCLHPEQPASTCQGALEVYYNLQKALSAWPQTQKITCRGFLQRQRSLNAFLQI
jgi:glycine dehydrogenase subunit 2